MPRVLKKKRPWIPPAMHICFIAGHWYAFRNKWKAHWFREYGPVACRKAETIPELIKVLKKDPL